MRFVTVHLQCDWPGCSVEAPEGDDSIGEKTLAVDLKAARTFVLCKPHQDTLDEVLLPLMQKALKSEAPSAPRKYTKRVGGGAMPVEGGLDCLVEGCGRHFDTNIGLGQHAIRTHGFTNLADYRAKYVPDHSSA